MLVAFAVGVGLLLLLVPGLILLTYVSMVTPAIVLEHRDIRGALHRSKDLVSGDGLRVFIVIVITIVLAAVFAVVIRAALQPLPDLVGFYLATVVANSVSVPFVALTWTVMYFQLKRKKDPFPGG